MLKPGGEVVLSAGAIGSPQILQLAGVGPGELLQELDIPVRLALPGVEMHPFSGITASVCQLRPESEVPFMFNRRIRSANLPSTRTIFPRLWI